MGVEPEPEDPDELEDPEEPDEEEPDEELPEEPEDELPGSLTLCPPLVLLLLSDEVFVVGNWPDCEQPVDRIINKESEAVSKDAFDCA